MTTIDPVHSIGAPCCTSSDRSIAATGGTKTTRMPSICLAAVVLIATLVAPAGAVIQRFWDAGDGFWSNPANWSPNGVPSNTENIFIGELTQNHTVTLDQDAAIASLHINNGIELLTNGHQLIAYDLTTLSDGASMTISGAGLGIDYYTDDFSILQTSTVTFDEAILEVGNFVIAENATLQGIGQTLLWGSGMTTFSNSGSVMFGSGASGIYQLNDGLYDLDGPFDGVLSAGSIAIGGPSAEALVTISGLGTTDPFSGTLTLGPHARLNMVVGGWEADADSQIEVTGGGGGPDYVTSRLDGSHVTLAGSINVSGHAQFLVNADATIEPTATLNVAPDNIVEFESTMPLDAPQETTINGGVFTIAAGSSLAFNNMATVRGGVFSTLSGLSSDGRVAFSGPTEWDGAVTLNGFAVQNWLAKVTGPTVIDADVFDMDGDGGGTTWDVKHSLIVNAAHVDAIQLGDLFNGTIDVGAGAFAPHLTINLDAPKGSWTMAGDMNLGGVQLGSSYVSRLAGSPVHITGNLNVEYRVRVTADTTIDEGSVVSFADDATALQMTGRTIVRPGATFVGTGLLDNGQTGQMMLADGASLDQVGLTNRGLLEIGDSPGFASIDRFTNLSSGTWRVEIGGELLGDEFDHLQVTGGGAALDGLLDVDLIAPPGLIIGPGSGPFMPEVGDTFTILTALGGVDGQFINSNPVSKAGGKLFHWSVIYHPFDVQLQLTSIAVPEPASVTLLIAAAIAMRARRRPRKVSLGENNLLPNACQNKDQTHD